MKAKAVILLAKCPQHGGQTYGMRVQQKNNRGNEWERTWAFPIDMNKAKHEGYENTVINGSMSDGDEYPGCPYCGGHGYVLCGCGKLNCFNGESRVFKCQWCGEVLDSAYFTSLTGNEDYSVGGDY